MAARDLKSNIKMAVLHAKVAVTTTQSIVGLDISGFQGAMIVVNIGTWTANDLVVTYQEKDTGGSWADIAEANLVGAGTVQSRAIVTGDTDTQLYVGYKGSKNNIGVVITDSGTGSAVIGACAIAGYPKVQPQNA